MSITSIILAGGLAKRMGGVDKGLISFLGKPMVSHVIERLKPQVAEILINANRETEQYRSFGFPVLHDQIGDFVGPLAGIHIGMKHAKTDYLLSVPCDSPLLSNNLAIKLMNALEENNADIAIAQTGEQTHPVFCLCKTNLHSDLEEFLNNGGRKVELWQNKHRLLRVNFDEQPMAFSNINSIDDLIELEHLSKHYTHDQHQIT
jgi:molybdopterin-guanine dinucleotide biosynthesis protein A